MQTTSNISCIRRKQSGIWVMWADRLAFSHSERIWPGIGPRLVGGPKKSPRVITVLVLRPRYRFLPRYHPSSQSFRPSQTTMALGLRAHISFSLLSTVSLSHFLSLVFYFLMQVISSVSIFMSILVTSFLRK